MVSAGANCGGAGAAQGGGGEARGPRDERFLKWREGQEWSLTEEELVDAVEREFGELPSVADRLGFPLSYILERVAKSPWALQAVAQAAENEAPYARRHFRQSLHAGRYWAVSMKMRAMYREEQELRQQQRDELQWQRKLEYARLKAALFGKPAVGQPAAEATVQPVAVAQATSVAPPVLEPMEVPTPAGQDAMPRGATAVDGDPAGVSSAATVSTLLESVALELLPEMREMPEMPVEEFTPEQQAQREQILDHKWRRGAQRESYHASQQLLEGGSPVNQSRDAGYLSPTAKKQLERVGRKPERPPDPLPGDAYRRRFAADEPEQLDEADQADLSAHRHVDLGNEQSTDDRERLE